MESARVFLRRSLLPYVKSRTFYLNVGMALMGLLLGRVDLFPYIYPFGVALGAAADLAALNYYYPMFGVIISGILLLPHGLTPVTGVLLYLSGRLLYKLIKKRQSKADKLLILAITQLLLLPMFYMANIQRFLEGVSGIALVLLLCIVFQNGLRGAKNLWIKGRLKEEEQVAVCFLLGSFALSLCEIKAYSFSMSIVIITGAAIFTAYAKGFLAVGVCVALGGMLVLGGEAQPLLIADIAACTFCAALCRRLYGVWGPISGFLVCAAITERYLGGAGAHVGIVNAFPAALILALTPKGAMLFMCAALDSNAREEKTARDILSRLQSDTAKDIIETANTVQKVAKLFPKEAKWQYDYEKEKQEILEAAGFVCADCIHRGSCWRSPNDTLATIEEMIDTIDKGSRPRVNHPIYNGCKSVVALANAALFAKETYRKDCARSYYQKEQQAFAHRQLMSIGDIIKTLSEEVKKRAWPDENASLQLRKRLLREGVVLKDALVERYGQERRVQVSIQAATIEERRMEELVSKAMERPMRLLRVERQDRLVLLQFEQRRKLSFTTGSATKPMAGSNASGDSTGYINLWGGRALFALSDGMGSGLLAQRQSQEAINLLLKMYEVGFNRDEALECVNRLLINNGKGDMYATLDVLLLDLKDGQAQFIKFGAPPCFVLRDGHVYTVYAEALPAGIIDEATAAINTASLRRNDIVVLLTDGVLEALGEETEGEILRCVGGANTCDEGARELLNTALEKNASDDMTALVVRLE